MPAHKLSAMNTNPLQSAVQDYGLHVLELANFRGYDSAFFDFDLSEFKSIALIGNRGSSYWSVFEQSPEYVDNQVNPLDRWSRRIGEQLAEEIGARVIFPFDGPPFYPFQQWAKRAGSLEQSPMGLMIHPEYGLWHSYRFGLLLRSAEANLISQPVISTTPCQTCSSQACLNTCPAGAFDKHGYKVRACVGYLRDNPDALCHSSGCQARLACPVGEDHKYQPTQNRFHLKAFLDSRE